jgi:hypothetical protein
MQNIGLKNFIANFLYVHTLYETTKSVRLCHTTATYSGLNPARALYM